MSDAINGGGGIAARPVTLFTGQWADLPFEEVARLAGEWGYDGLEIACWGDHLDPVRAAHDDAYVQDRLRILAENDLAVHAIAIHLTGQAVCDDPIDERHQGILAPEVWGDGDAEGVRQRAADVVKDAARAAARLGATTVTGFTGSSIWKYVAMFPPASEDMITRGYEDFAARWNPIMDVFDAEGVRFALEVHPSEIAYDYWTAQRTLEVMRDRPGFGLNFDPSHFMWQDLDPVMFLQDFAPHIFHVHVKESVRNLNGRNGRLGSHLAWGDPRRGWDFVTAGHGDVPWEPIFRMLNSIGYAGPTSIEWEDAGMDRLTGAPRALALVRHLSTIAPPAASFDAAFSSAPPTNDSTPRKEAP
ncbi:Hydroxypyruvate isomerase [Arthrobacter agilis]|uniref:sugar phosphate isomerase/epimerase family protein n=1 Tax=Arthrobacter agilis TaxID=37921 RepID=UPI000F6B660C|nr:sugar phosphate isomerase/epimerase family protein [Arthrobacter agilis]VDR30956.1 Hydroxypyruvate isomerase [Arthrobacter agilis]